MDLLTKPQEKQNHTKFLHFVIPFDKTTVQVASVTNIGQSSNQIQIYQEFESKQPLFLSLQRHKNLKEILVHTRFTSAFYETECNQKTVTFLALLKPGGGAKTTHTKVLPL